MTTDDELRELIAKGEKATARPWSFYDAFDVVGNPGIVAANRLGTNDTTVIGACLHGYDEIHVIEADADYLCAAANLAPEIAAELIAARFLVEQLRKAIESVRDVGWYSPVTPEYKAAWKKVDATLKGGDA